MTSSILWVLLLFVGFTLVAALKGKAGGTGMGRFPHRPAKALFHPAEGAFLGVLDQAVSPRRWVFGDIDNAHPISISLQSRAKDIAES